MVSNGSGLQGNVQGNVALTPFMEAIVVSRMEIKNIYPDKYHFLIRRRMFKTSLTNTHRSSVIFFSEQTEDHTLSSYTYCWFNRDMLTHFKYWDKSNLIEWCLRICTILSAASIHIAKISLYFISMYFISNMVLVNIILNVSYIYISLFLSFFNVILHVCFMYHYLVPFFICIYVYLFIYLFIESRGLATWWC